MRDQIVNIMSKKITPIRKNSGAFIAYKGGKFFWLQKKAESFLRKYGTEYWFMDDSISYVSIDTNHFAEKMSKQWIEFINTYNKDPKIVYMGIEDFIEIQKEPFMERIGFNMRAKIGDEYGITWRNLPVEVIPHMKGILIV